MFPAPSRETLFSPDSLMRYPDGIAPGKLRHAYSDVRVGPAGKPIDFSGAVLLLEGLKADVAGWYKKETGKGFDTYRLGDMLDAVRSRFWSDSRFEEAFSLLQLDSAGIRKARIPWWNEIAGTETGHIRDGDGFLVMLAPRHSLETQLVRSGVKRDIRSVSVGGIVESSDGRIAIGLRGGATFPNTYHINAGALGITERLKAGADSIFDFYRAEELAAEFGLLDSDILSASALSRVYDRSIDSGPMYVFLVRAALTFDELAARYDANTNSDRGEHTRLVPIGANGTEVMQFISSNYRGLVANREGRKDDERFLLHPGALALLSYADYPLDGLRALFQDGVW